MLIAFSAGVALSIVFGLLIGNYATTLLYRLPRGISICGINVKYSQPPCCSTCGHLLKFYEYLPLLSWFSTFGKCNYCGARVNRHYFILEVLTAIVAVIAFFMFGYTDLYIFIVFLTATSVLSVLLYIENNGLIINSITAGIVLLGAFYRTVCDRSVIPWLFDLLTCMVVIIGLLKYEKMYNSQLRKEMVSVLLPVAAWLGSNSYITWLPYYILTIGLAYIYNYILHFISRKHQYNVIFPAAMIIFCCCMLIHFCIHY